MVNFYVIQIRDLKTITIDDVPKLWRKKVKEKLEDEMEDVVLTETAVVVDENIITSQGVGTAIDFGLKLIEILDGEEKAKEIADSIVF